MTEKIITDALGFPLTLTITFGDFEILGQHKYFEDYETGLTDAGSPHTIKIKKGIGDKLYLVAAHEAYHLFRSIRHLITCDEETEAETFGELVSKIIKTGMTDL